MANINWSIGKYLKVFTYLKKEKEMKNEYKVYSLS